MTVSRSSFLLTALLLLIAFSLGTTVNVASAASPSFDESRLEGLRFRGIGPYRGGRSAAVCGVAGDPLVWYFGATGGGVWKSVDGGQSWKPVSDGFFGGSIGAVAVCAGDANVVYAGGGEVTVRGNVSHGDGVWKSTDAGRNWTHVGLEDSRHIPRIRVHPRDPDRVYAAVLGHLYGPNEQRGIYRSLDGGENWERILYVNDEVGAVDLAMDPTNPRILYASFWRVRRTPYSLESGGEGSSIWMSRDGGDSWEEITHRPGLPAGEIGISGIAVSAADPDRVWAIIEAEEGGVFRSDDQGESWTRVNSERTLRQRAWYYTRIYADPADADKVYVVNVGLWRSKDGGRSFERIRTPHGDHHDLWIAPEDPRRMIVADDGGAQVSYDGGNNWTTYYNQPTAQFYRVTTDNHFPYRILGAQQDNTTVRILHRTGTGSITIFDWEPSAGGESGWLAPDPLDEEIVYGGSYGGLLTRYDHRTGQTRVVNVWPDDPLGHGAEDMNPRFQWNFPILFSRHDPHLLYAAGNILFTSRNEGQSWQPISGDLTRADPTTLKPSGGPITKDNTGVEYYATIFSVAEDVFEEGAIWCGSDDGLVHLTRDGGASWQDVTPPRKLLGEWAQINCIEADPFHPGGVYLAATRYKSDDFHPYLLRSRNWGKSWKRIDKGIAPDHFTRVLRADPVREGLLYCGTEMGLYISFDDGDSWQTLQLNLPVVPITDLAVKDDDLVVATQGRSFWVLDDLSVLRQWNEQVCKADTWLFTPRPSYRLTGRGRWPISSWHGEDLPEGVLLRYRLPDEPDSSAFALRILQGDGTVIRTFTAGAKEKKDRLPLEPPLQQLRWDLRYPDALTVEGMILWDGMTRGPRALPGKYRARLVAGDDSMEVDFEVLADPRSSASFTQLKEQFDFLLEVRDELSRTHRAILRLREVRRQADDLAERLQKQDGDEEIIEAAKALSDTLTSIEKALYQTRNRSPQDPLNFPIRLNNKLAALAGAAATGDFEPTDQMRAVRRELMQRIGIELSRLDAVYATRLRALNELVRKKKVPAVILPPEEDGEPPAGSGASVKASTSKTTAATTVATASMDPSELADWRASVEAWHRKRVERLRQPDSWLTLVGLFPLHEGDNTMGSAPDNDMVLEKKFPAHLGVVDRKGETFHFTPAEEVTFTLDGRDLDGPVELAPDTSGHPTIVRHGAFGFYVIQRGDRFFVRAKDNDNPLRASFHGIERFPVDPSWRITARWVAYERPRSLEIPNVLGQLSEEPLYGEIVFTHEGQTIHLYATGDPGSGEQLSLIFGDTTNGEETYGGGRFLDIDPPRPDGTIVVDFNLAYDPPCVFTPYATCPLPPPENVLPFAVTAGEKTWGEGHLH